MAELMCQHGCDYLLQIKANQGDTLDALEGRKRLALRDHIAWNPTLGLQLLNS